jgi:hypothetical protein
LVSLTLLTFYFQYKIHPISIGQLAGGLGSETSLVAPLREMCLPASTVRVKLSAVRLAAQPPIKLLQKVMAPTVASLSQPQLLVDKQDQCAR